MMAVVIDGIVDNIVVVDGDWTPPVGELVALDGPVDIGWTYSSRRKGSKFRPSAVAPDERTVLERAAAGEPVDPDEFQQAVALHLLEP